MTLFVGGPKDGTQREMPESHGPYCIITTSRMPAPVYFDQHMRTTLVKTITYTRYNKLSIAGVEIFAEESLSVSDIVRKLVEGYRP